MHCVDGRIGEQATKSLMGHKQSSDAVHTSYSGLPARFNMMGVHLEGDLELMNVPLDERSSVGKSRQVHLFHLPKKNWNWNWNWTVSICLNQTDGPVLPQLNWTSVDWSEPVFSSSP